MAPEITASERRLLFCSCLKSEPWGMGKREHSAARKAGGGGGKVKRTRERRWGRPTTPSRVRNGHALGTWKWGDKPTKTGVLTFDRV